ncbi:HupE/UreJ family protein [Leisingera sp. MMG026]|uniref:HupE/UreJ family protein n=1 Tax=Leisingera sp. MMG026 TaxID=2909982 RepID=UPI001F21D39A|nr:HupE/UreJ family protein [Leisingera sp. MMG026]MCF6433350.1 HupE/UreJ family protein [Leisingera sp. MMG026]
MSAAFARVAACVLAALVLTLVRTPPAAAHEARPVYVEIAEISPGHFSASWKAPVTVDLDNIPQVVLPAPCRLLEPTSGPGAQRHRLYDCAPDLSGLTVRVDYPRHNPAIASLIRFTRLSGETYLGVLEPGKTGWTIPARERPWQVAGQYAGLGIDHILQGWDHLLFVACLIFLTGTPRRMALAVTGFTAAHSLTLAFAAFGILRASVAPVEAVIALSVAFLASELARNKRGTLSWRYPIFIAALFGLLHGFGFATVLRETGLPQTEALTALLFFNLGVEIGQILFLTVTLAACQMVRVVFCRGKDLAALLQKVQRPASYPIGVLAVYWTLNRTAQFWG